MIVRGGLLLLQVAAQQEVVVQEHDLPAYQAYNDAVQLHAQQRVN